MAEVTDSVEEYLEMIYRLQERDGSARTSELVKALNVAPGSITNTVERLENESLLVHEPYRGVKLTEKGRKIALRVIRKHRLCERLLTDVLDVKWDKAHDDACRLEHAVSDELTEKIERTLKHPKTCPHGNPIPTERGGMAEESFQPLNKFSLQRKGIIAKIADESQELLQYLDTLGLKPETSLQVVEKVPFADIITVRVDGKDHTLSHKIAALIKVREADE